MFILEQHLRACCNFVALVLHMPMTCVSTYTSGESYYMEAVHWQNTGPWRIGIGAKIHNLSWTEDVANIDYEEQTIRITSTVVHETQVSEEERKEREKGT